MLKNCMKLLLILMPLIFLSIISGEAKSTLTGSIELGYEYIDIDNPLNNTSYNRGSTHNFRFLTTDKINSYNFSGIGNLTYNKDKSSKKFLIETLRLEFANDRQSFLFGQYYPQFSELTINNQKMEGININLFRKHFDVNIFGGISNQYEKITELNSTPKYQQYLYGIKTDYKLGIHKIYITAFQAQEDKSSIDTGIPSLGPIKNNLIALGFTGIIPNEKGKFKFEYSATELDDDRKDSIVEKTNDWGILTSLDYNLLKNLRTTLQYKNFGNGYYTTGNQSLNSSAVGYNGILFQYEYALEKTMFSGYYENYFEESFDTSGIKTKYWIFDNSIKQRINDNNEITFSSYLKDTKKEDGTNDKFKYTGKISYSKKLKTAKISGNINYSKTDDKTISNADSKVKGFSINYSDKYFKNKMYFSTFIMANNTTGDINFFMINTNINHKLIPNKFLITANLGYQLNSNPTELTRTYTNKLNFKYYLSFEKTIEFELKNDRKFAVSGYNVWDTVLKYAMIF
ncbi:hypothetical protein KA977_11855 [Candidatus Dependentiae bacterium]|nr:hypothetical protein [Candidatus Dependentiae bacterium]